MDNLQYKEQSWKEQLRPLKLASQLQSALQEIAFNPLPTAVNIESKMRTMRLLADKVSNCTTDCEIQLRSSDSQSSMLAQAELNRLADVNRDIFNWFMKFGQI